MAAETLSTVQVAINAPVFKASGSNISCCSWGTYAVAAAMEDGDIFEMSRVPAGAIVTGGYLQQQDMDSGIEALDIMVGWAANGSDAADPNGLMLANVVTGDVSVHLESAQTLIFFGGVLLTAGPKTLVNETIIQVENNTAPATHVNAQMSTYTNYLNP